MLLIGLVCFAGAFAPGAAGRGFTHRRHAFAIRGSPVKRAPQRQGLDGVAEAVDLPAAVVEDSPILHA